MATEVLDIIRKAYQLEVDGYTFYSMTAERATKPAVQTLFERLAKDERQHQDFLKDVAIHFGEQGPKAFEIPGTVPDLSAFTNAVFTEEVREQAEGADFEAAVLSVGMMLESNSIAHYGSAAKAATEEQVHGFYQFLGFWERQHLIALQNAYNAVRSDFWKKSGL
jgi:rubrerythrin